VGGPKRREKGKKKTSPGGRCITVFRKKVNKGGVELKRGRNFFRLKWLQSNKTHRKDGSRGGPRLKKCGGERSSAKKKRNGGKVVLRSLGSEGEEIEK